MDDRARDHGSAALLVLMGGGMAMLLALVLLIAIADLVVTRGQAQLAADAAALAAMGEQVWPAAAHHGGDGHDTTGAPGGGAAGDGHRTAAALARANGGTLLDCCGDQPLRREVEVAVVPASALLRPVVPRVRARAAAALASLTTSVDPQAGATASALGSGTARQWPVSGPVSSGFGMRTHPVTGGARLHAGLDLAVPTGTPIRAAAAGRVVRADMLGGYGQVVDLAHADGVITRYAHQSRVLVTTGQQVAAGQVIGLVGATGTATGPHLHFEVRTAAGPTDPLAWLPQAAP